jgi:hypothetical protein
MLVCAPGGHTLVTDGRYDGYVRDAMRAGTLAAVGLERVETRYDDALLGRLQAMNASTVGFEAEQVTVATLDRWKASLPGANGCRPHGPSSACD